MPKRLKIAVITLLILASLVISFGVGCALRSEVNSEQNLDITLDIVEEAWSIIFRDYVDRDRLDVEALREGAIRGMIEALDDPHSAYLDIEAYHLSMEGLEGKFEGIGAYIGVDEDGKLMIIAPIDESPADKAGVRAGDAVLEIDGASAAEMSLAEAVLAIRGPKGTSVRLLVLHQGEIEPEEIEIIREEIELSSVYFEMMEDIVYLRITNFTERTDDELFPLLEEIKQEGATGMVLDLRSNPGGLLSTVIDVASRFLDDGVVVYVVDNEGEKTASSVRRKGVVTELPLVVLVDSYSASGSEVLAGALQDHNRATIAGSQTYGKGSINILRQLTDGSGIYITTGRWQTPNGRFIEGEGIKPDYLLEPEEEDAIQWAIDYLNSNK